MQGFARSAFGRGLQRGVGYDTVPVPVTDYADHIGHDCDWHYIQ